MPNFPGVNQARNRVKERCIRSTIGMCLMHEGWIRLDGTDRLAKVRWGVADTYFTCPAMRKVEGRTVYGFVSKKSMEDDLTFTRSDDQREAAKAWKESIKP